MKLKFEYIVGYKDRFNTLKEARTFAESHEIDEIGITKGGVYQAISRLNSMSERYERIVSVNKVKAAINKFLESNK